MLKTDILNNIKKHISHNGTMIQYDGFHYPEVEYCRYKHFVSSKVLISLMFKKKRFVVSRYT